MTDILITCLKASAQDAYCLRQIMVRLFCGLPLETAEICLACIFEPGSVRYEIMIYTTKHHCRLRREWQHSPMVGHCVRVE